MRYRILLLCLGLLIVGAFSVMAHPKQCSTDRITKLARAGFSDSEIQEFCILTETQPPANLRDKYALLEGKNWRTHYFLTQARRKREEVFFEVNQDAILLTSSNPQVQYFEVQDLGDTIRFKRKQAPFKAIYVLTLALDQMTATSLPVLQQYKKVTQHTWTAQ